MQSSLIFSQQFTGCFNLKSVEKENRTNDGFNRLAVEMMGVYNKESAIVFNTQQCYLKKALKTVTLDLEQAKRQNFYYGAKLVRGAYMEQERARAALLGYKDPINADFEATSAMYHSVLDECLTRIKAFKDAGDDPQKIGIMVASHNADTIRYGVKRYKSVNTTQNSFHL